MMLRSLVVAIAKLSKASINWTVYFGVDEMILFAEWYPVCSTFIPSYSRKSLHSDAEIFFETTQFFVLLFLFIHIHLGKDQTQLL